LLALMVVGGELVRRAFDQASPPRVWTGPSTVREGAASHGSMNPADWITNDDYPPEALRHNEQGTVTIRWSIHLPAGCAIAKSWKAVGMRAWTPLPVARLPGTAVIRRLRPMRRYDSQRAGSYGKFPKMDRPRVRQLDRSILPPHETKTPQSRSPSLSGMMAGSNRAASSESRRHPGAIPALRPRRACGWDRGSSLTASRSRQSFIGGGRRRRHSNRCDGRMRMDDGPHLQ